MIEFFDADPAKAKTLTPDQVEKFNKDGYISPLDGLSQQATADSLTYFDSLLDRIRDMNDRRNAYSIMGYQNRCRGIWELAQTPLFLDYVEDLIGPDIICWSTHYFCKQPNDIKRVPWHQDATYWPVRPTKTVTIWLAIDDVTEENAPMRFLPGTHRGGKYDWKPATGEFVLAQEIEDAADYGEPFDNILKAGQLSIHASTLIHGSEPNHSDKRRCGLTFRYIPSDCGVKEGAERVLADGIVCRGKAGNWKRTERPPNDDISMIHNHYRD
ncbi:MAG: phytanoyl-CoA dioxygenase family protein [Pseudomonadota bacterium]